MRLFYVIKRGELRLTDLEMFETAYVAIFEKQGYVVPDYVHFVEFQHHPNYQFPPYMRRWLASLQEVPCANVIAPSAPVTSSLAAASSGSGESSLTSE